jgi:hypothetical protein
MRMNEYMLLSTEEKADLLWEKGLFIDSQNSANFNRALYHLQGFYVELTLDKSTNEITGITPYRTPAELERAKMAAVLN